VSEPTPEKQLADFLGRYDPKVAARARAARRSLRALLPDAVELVYDNYNALVIAFGRTERPSGLVLSIALYPRWVTLFFMEGARLGDPRGMLAGSGKHVRGVVLETAGTLETPAVRALICQAWRRAGAPAAAGRKVVIQSVSAKQRPRRPAKP
jgi:hypothetical protein